MCILFQTNKKGFGQIRPDEIKSIVSEAREKYNLPSVAVVLLNSEEVIHYEIQGLRIANTDNAVSENDFYHIGSCSKSVLALIAGKLVEENKIDWGTRFFALFPELRTDSDIRFYDISLEDLLTCTAGIKSYTNMLKEPFPEIEEGKEEKYQFAKYLLNGEPASKYKNGRFKYLYSNASYTLALLMLEKITGFTYEQLIDLYVVKEMGIETLIGFPNKHDKEQPWGHLFTGTKLEVFSPDHQYVLPSLIKPAGDLSMQPLGFAKYIQENLRGLLGNGNFVSKETYEKIHFGHKEFSLGVGNGRFRGYKLSGIDGSAGTFFCRSLVLPDIDIALIIMTNAGSGKGQMKAVEYITNKVAKKFFK